MAAFVLMGLSCGGNTVNSDRDPGDAPLSAGAAGVGGGSAGAPAALSPASLRFEKIAAGRDRFCGITHEDGRLVCVSGDRIQSDRRGPYVDLSANEDIPSWSYLCAVRKDGTLECEGVELPLPAGPFEHVSVGFFNACASGPERVACWLDPAVGGIEPPPVVGDDFSVDMYSYCHRPVPLYAECFSQGAPLLPIEAHYLDVVATPKGACAALLGTPAELLPRTVSPELRELATKSQIACFSPDGVHLAHTGEFSSFDVESNGRNGCAIRASDGAIECWGAPAIGAPLERTGALQVSVSSTLSCALWSDRTVSCW